MADIIISSDDDFFALPAGRQRSSHTTTRRVSLNIEVDTSVEEILLKLTELRAGITRHISKTWRYMSLIERLRAAWFPEMHRFLPDHIRSALIAADEVAGLVEQIHDRLSAKQLQ